MTIVRCMTVSVRVQCFRSLVCFVNYASWLFFLFAFCHSVCCRCVSLSVVTFRAYLLPLLFSMLSVVWHAYGFWISHLVVEVFLVSFAVSILGIPSWSSFKLHPWCCVGTMRGGRYFTVCNMPGTGEVHTRRDV